MSQLNIPAFSEFRSIIDHIKDARTQYICKLSYLLASRVDEVCTKKTAGDDTKPYGIYLDWDLKTFQKAKKRDQELKANTLLIKVPMLKKKTKNPHSPKYRFVALPVEQHYEPWTTDLIRHISSHRKLAIDLTRRWVYELMKRELYPKFGLEPNPKEHYCNILRHCRLSHLIDEYDFEMMDLVRYAGWSVRTTGNAMGVPTGQADIYLHLKWRKYYPKLLIPYQDLVSS